MEAQSTYFYRLWLAVAALGAGITGCTGVADPMIAGGFPTASDLSLDNNRAVTEPACVEAGDPASDIHRAIFDLLNQYRIDHELEPLIYSKRLEASGDAYVQDLWQRGYFAHVNPEGQNPGDRALVAGFCHRYVGENLAAGQPTPERAMQAWINSPSHNENMLDARYIYVGIGHAVDGNGRHYWAQEFSWSVP